MTIYRFKSAKQFESLSKIEIIYDRAIYQYQDQFQEFCQCRFDLGLGLDILVKISLFRNQLQGKICRTVKSCFHHSFINRPQCRRICIAIYSVHWYSRGAESDDQTFEKHWINNWQTELNILLSSIKNAKILYSILTS